MEIIGLILLAIVCFIVGMICMRFLFVAICIAFPVLVGFIIIVGINMVLNT